jgi:hypothetical protein
MTYITKDEFFDAMMRIDRKLERIASTGPRFITRSQIIQEIGETNYNYGVSHGWLSEIKGPARNSRILIERSEYENFITIMKR